MVAIVRVKGKLRAIGTRYRTVELVITEPRAVATGCQKSNRNLLRGSIGVGFWHPVATALGAVIRGDLAVVIFNYEVVFLLVCEGNTKPPGRLEGQGRPERFRHWGAVLQSVRAQIRFSRSGSAIDLAYV
jgi:hypothetical protein